LVISCFGVIILSVLGALFKTNHHTLVGSTEDPENGPAVAATAFAAVGVYGVCFPAGCLMLNRLRLGRPWLNGFFGWVFDTEC
jgi:hypothetical protein